MFRPSLTAPVIAWAIHLALPGLAQSQGAFPPAGLTGEMSDTTGIVFETLQLYDQGRISDAEHLALRALATPERLSAAEQLSLLRLLAFCAVANDNEEMAVKAFVDALRLNPSLTPDPITWSPKVRRVFQRAREDFTKIREGERHIRIAAEAGISRRAAIKSLYLPGAGQVMKGQTQRGYIFAASLGLATAAFVYTNLSLADAHDDYRNAGTPQDAHTKWLQYRNLTISANVAGIAVATIYVYTFFDALIRPPTGEGIKD